MGKAIAAQVQIGEIRKFRELLRGYHLQRERERKTERESMSDGKKNSFYSKRLNKVIAKFGLAGPYKMLMPSTQL